MVVRFLWLLFIAIITGCTAAVPNVSSLGESLFLSSKSPSPFDQQSNSGAIIFSGTCTAMTSTFEYRIDGVTAWQSISLTAPAPSYGEWIPGGSIYDVNCSDGSFNFYIFVSQIISAATAHYGALGSDYEPNLIEIRTLNSSHEVIPGTISFQRPIPAAYRINGYHSPHWWMGVVEREQPVVFEVSLISSSGNEAKPSNPLVIDLTAEVATGSSAGLGTFYYPDCITAIDVVAKTFTTGDRRKSFCYIPNNVTPGARMRILASGNGLTSHSHEFNVVSLNSVILELRPLRDYENQLVPSILVKGADYKLKSVMNTFENPSLTRNVQSFSGSINVASGSSDVNFSRVGNDASCPVTSANTMTCTSSFRTQIPFKLNVPVTSTLSNLNLNLSASENAGCSNCFINYSLIPSSVAISSYQSQNFNYQLVSGPLTYSRPAVEFPDDSLKHFECREVAISLANSNGHTLPAPAQAPTLRILGNSGLSFHRNWGCSATSGSFAGTIQKMVLRPDGKILVVGTFSNHGSAVRRRFAVINPDGSLDLGFVGPDTYFNGNITAMLPLPDGRTLVAGDTSNLANDALTKDFMVLLRPDGRVESSFPFRTNGAVYSMVYDPTTSKIFIAGSFSELYENATLNSRGRIAAFNYSVDSGAISLDTWGSTLSINSTVFSLLVHSGKLYIGGGFTEVYSTPVNLLARLDIATVALDAWPSGFIGPNNTIQTMDYDPNQNRIIIGGIFTSVNSTVRSRIAAFDVTTGNLTSFDPNANSTVVSLKVVGSDLYVSGQFNLMGGAARKGLARLSMINDALATWNPASNGSGYHPLVISHEAAFIAGSFTNLGGISANILGRVDLVNALGMIEFGTSSPSNQTALSFSPDDLIKKIFVRANSSIVGPATISVTDGIQTVNIDLEVRP